MKRSRCRNLLLPLIVASTTAGLGDGLSAKAGPATPATSVRRVTALRGQVIAADFNGDGIIDLASTSTTPAIGAKPIVVALGRGDGTFNAPTSSGTNGGVLAAGDFNKDGKLDLIANVSDATDMPVKILLGKGDGTFSPPIQIGSAIALEITFGIAADFDGDGNLDVGIGFVDEADDDSVIIYQGHGDGTFSDVVARLHTGTASFPAGAVTADLNHDGKPDVVVANHWGKSLSIFLNHGSFVFTASDRPLGRGANDVTAVDLNGDGNLDLIVAESLSRDAADPNFEDGSIAVFPGKGDGSFGNGESYSTGFGAWRVVTGDFNRDGILDVATANLSAVAVEDCGPLYKTWDSISILTGVGDGTFSGGSDFSIGNQHNIDDTRYRRAVRSLAAVDVDGDHALDLVVSDGVIFTNKAPDANWAPTVTAGSTTPAADHSVTLRAVADDVDQDVLVYSWTDSGGMSIPPVPDPCITPSTLGIHTFTVTVDDTHGHRATSSTTVDFGGGGSEDHTIHISAPAAGEVVTGAQPYTIRWTAAAAMGGEEVFILISTNGGPATHIWECDYTQVSTGHCVWQNPGPAAENARISIVTRDADFAGSGSTGPFSIRYAAGQPPYPWQHRDIGAVATAGGTTFSGGIFKVTGSGADIWDRADELQYAFVDNMATGNQSTLNLVARVDSVQNVNPWTKAGVMIRASLDPASPQASVFVSPTKGVVFQRRLAQGGLSFSTAGPAITAPLWVRVTMQPNGFGETVRGYYKTNPADPWTAIGQDNTATVWGQPFSGLAVSSHADGTLATGVFSSVSASHVPDWSSATVGPYPGTATVDGDTATVRGRGTDIWNSADQFMYLSDICFGDCTITARVQNVENTNPWAKAGVMFRETLNGPSRQVDMIVSPSKGAAMQYRAATGGASAQGGASAGAVPGWVRLTRAGNVFTGYWSADGVTFTPVGTATVAMSYGVNVGLAVTSHNVAAAATGIFDNISIQQP